MCEARSTTGACHGRPRERIVARVDRHFRRLAADAGAVDAAFKASKRDVGLLSKEEARALLQTHTLKSGAASQQGLAQLQPGSTATFAGNNVKLGVATK